MNANGACSRICTYTLSHHLLRATCLLFHHTGKSPRVGVEPTCCNTHGRTELNRPASWDMERIPGLEPRTARRQRAVIPLNYIRMEEGWGLAPQAVKLNLFSRQLQYACLLNLPNGRGGGTWTHNLALIRDLLKPLKLLHNIVVFNFQCSKWCRGLELNQGHPRLQRGALPTELPQLEE